MKINAEYLKEIFSSSETYIECQTKMLLILCRRQREIIGCGEVCKGNFYSEAIRKVIKTEENVIIITRSRKISVVY